MSVQENINTWIPHLSTETKMSLSVDCVIFGYDDDGLKVLLIDCNMPPYVGKRSLLGDLVEMNETLENAVVRILQKRTTLTDIYFEEVKAYSEPDRHPLGRVVTVAYYSFIKISDYKIHDNEDKHLEWVPIEEIKNLAFDHSDILFDSYSCLKKKIRSHPIAFSLLPRKFTLMQLQKFYETVLQIKLDRRNFRRKLSSLDLLIDLDKVQDNVSHRPAKLYSFDLKKYNSRLKKGVLNFAL